MSLELKRRESVGSEPLMPEDTGKPKEPRKRAESELSRWAELGEAIASEMDAGYGRPNRLRWRNHELAHQLKGVTEAAVSQWKLGKVFPVLGNFEALITVLSKNEPPEVAKEIADRLMAVYRKLDNERHAARPSAKGTKPPSLAPDATAELRSVAERLLGCVEQWRQVEQQPPAPNAQRQLGLQCRLLLTIPDERPEDGIPRLARVQAALDDRVLPDLSEKGRRCLETIPIGGVVELLRRLSKSVMTATERGSHLVRGDDLRREDHESLVQELLAEIDRQLDVLRQPKADWPKERVATATNELVELASIVSADPLDLRQLEGARGRLEKVQREVALLHRAIALTRRVLGCHVDKLPPLAVFEERLKDGTFGPEMVVIPGGTFTMGSPPEEQAQAIAHGSDRKMVEWESPQHSVSVPRFALGRYAVTFEEYDRYCAAMGIEPPKDERWGRGRRPVIYVSWDDARNYCAWLSSETGKEYRLPSEAEWEYACRAGTTTPFSFGETISTSQVNYNGNYPYADGEKGEYRKKTVEVGHLPPNGCKLHEMHGNVAEWCEDDWHKSYEGAPADGGAWVEPPTARESGGRDHPVRGASWGDHARNVRAASRCRFVPSLRNVNFGFRCARGLE